MVVDYPLYWPSYEKLSTAFLETTNGIYAFVLSPRLEVAQSQRGERVLSRRDLTGSPTTTARTCTTPVLEFG